MTDRVDVAVVGAGFAGLEFARTAATRGLVTAVLERKPDPAAFPHTTGLLVREVADGWDLPRRLTRLIRGVRLYSPSLRSIDLDSPGYHFLATDTPGLLRWLAGRAQAAGAVVRTGASFAAARRERGLIRIEGAGLEARLVVGADGARSAVARAFGLGLNRDFLVGAESEYEGVRGVDADRLHVFLDSDLAPGYIGWVVPGVGITQVGVAGRQGGRPSLDEFTRRVGRLFDFSGARGVGTRGGLIPVGGPVRPFAAPGVLLVGDAAGLVSPLTAGGIHTALDSGRCAARAAAEHLLDGGPEPGDALREAWPRFRWKRALRLLFDLRPPNRLIDVLLGFSPFRAAARLVFFHHRGLFSAAGWRALLRGAGAR